MVRAAVITAVIQAESRVGATERNARLLIERYLEVADRCDVVVTPELSVTGYPAEDLLLSQSYIAEAREALAELATATEGKRARLLAGAPESAPEGKLWNSIFLCGDGKAQRVFRKRRLPNVGVFDEARYFLAEADNADDVFELPSGVRVRVLNCEELWSAVPVGRPADLVMSVNASPWRRAKHAARLAVARRRVSQERVPLIYVNTCGAQDDLIFDGGSFAVRDDGGLAVHLAHFREDFALIHSADLAAAGRGEHAEPCGAVVSVISDSFAQASVRAESYESTACHVEYSAAAASGGRGGGSHHARAYARAGASVSSGASGTASVSVMAHAAEGAPSRMTGGAAAFGGRDRAETGVFLAGGGAAQPDSEYSACVSRDDLSDLADALILAVRAYAVRNGFKRALVGLSGGLDSALVAVLAAEALGAGNVSCVYMPSPYSSDLSERDARLCAAALGCAFDVIPIDGMMEAARVVLDVPGRAEFASAPLAAENIQPRARGMILMALSAARGELLLATGNKSELATGYCTLYGDMCGGYAPLKDVYKTEAYALSRFLNARAGRELIPESVLTKAPTAELRLNQKDSDALPPYERLDGMLMCMIERKLSAEETVARGYDPDEAAQVGRLLRISEFKRRQAAPGPNVSMCAFGRERRMPISQG